MRQRCLPCLSHSPRHLGAGRIAFVSELHGTAEQRKALVAAQTARRIGAPLQQVFVMNADGSNPTQVTRDGGFAPTWSPDGRQVAFVGVSDWRADDTIQAWSAKRDIFVIDTDGRNLRNITRQAGSDNYPAWSPDGRWISFVSKRDGNSELYKMHPDGTVQTRLTNNPGFDAYASWSPTGQFLVFTHRSERTGFGSLFVMRADGTDTRAVGVVGRLGSWRASR